MNKYLVVDSKKIVQFNSYKEAFDSYETKAKPVGVYEVSKYQTEGEPTLVWECNINASFHGDFKAEDNFIHLQNRLNNCGYKVGTR